MTARNSLSLAVAAAFMVGLAGCSSGVGEVGAGGSGATAGPVKVDRAKRDALHQELMGLDSRFYMARPADHFTRNTGVGTYNGIASIGTRGTSPTPNGRYVSNMPQIIADMALSVDYVTDEVSASMWDFHSLSGQSADGSVQLRGVENLGNITAAGTGILYWGDREEILDVTLDGNVIGSDLGIRGSLDVVSTIGTDSTDLDGTFVTTRD